MPNVFDPFRFVVIAVAGWMNQKQQHAIEYLREENRVLREQLGSRRLRFTDDQRRRLATKAKLVGRRLLNDVASLVTPDTLLAWHRKLISEKYDGSTKRGPGRPRAATELEDLVVRLAQENRDWGYRRILGAMSNLGHSLARAVDHSTIARWVLHYGPILNERIRAEVRRPNRSWRVDETYIRVGGKWSYLYRAIDSVGNTIDFLLSAKRDRIAAKSFLQLALWSTGQIRPHVINVDGHPAYPGVVDELKRVTTE